METNNKYFKVIVSYKMTANIPETIHIVRAKSNMEAVTIAKKHRISNTKDENQVNKRHARVLNMQMDFNKIMILNRRKGINGCIWYEDEEGHLAKESDRFNFNKNTSIKGNH
jgi:hypothetical protein